MTGRLLESQHDDALFLQTFCLRDMTAIHCRSSRDVGVLQAVKNYRSSALRAQVGSQGAHALGIACPAPVDLGSASG
jgi:hypothetical protein